MAGLAGRFSVAIKSKVSRLLDRAEDPGETLDYSYQKQIELLQQVKAGIANVVTAKKRLQLQTDKLQAQVSTLDGQAREALAQGDAELARLALERKQALTAELGSLGPQIAELESQQQGLIEKQRTLQRKVEAFRSQKEVIKAQYSAAEAQVRISEAASGVGEEMADVGLAMQRASEKAENMKARASALDELDRAGAFDDVTAIGQGNGDIDRRLAELSSKGAVDDEMANLKSELGSGRPPAQLEAGSAEAEERA